MPTALYARVSTRRQERDQTVDSQLDPLRRWIEAQGEQVNNERVYVDDGYTGARLDRPALDRLRDDAHEGRFDHLVVYSPDRLARKYAYQALLLEEFRRLNVEVHFLHHPISDDPSDQLLLQIQGAVAEYERALLSDRFRRGRLQKAKQGVFLSGRAPYGYRYVCKQDATPSHLVVDEDEAEMVRTLYRWLVDEAMTVRQILRRLNETHWRPRSGRTKWQPSVVHHILTDPVYSGTAYANRYRFVAPVRPRSTNARGPENTCRQPRPKEEWIAIPVPPIIDAETYERASEQLARNATLSFRNNTKHRYLLRCLLRCRSCGLSITGRTYKATAHKPQRVYYQCGGRDALMSARETPCRFGKVDGEQVERLVWDHVSTVLAEPERLLEGFEEYARQAEVTAGHSEVQKTDAALARLDREERRLLDAYQADVLTLAELADRKVAITSRREGLHRVREQQVRLATDRRRAAETLNDVTTFCERIRTRLDTATFDEKQAILQLLVDTIVVGEDTLEIHYVIPLRAGPPGLSRGESQLRSDGVQAAHLPGPFPTRVGMNRRGASRLARPLPVPHTHGDEPRASTSTSVCGSRSPHAWG